MKIILRILLLLILVPVKSNAHEIRPAYLEIKEDDDHSLQITWKQPLMGEYGLPLHPFISAGWMEDSPAHLSYTESYLIKRWNIPPDHASLDEQVIHINGLEKTMTDVFVQVSMQNNFSFSYLIKPIQPFVKLSLSKPQSPPVWDYLKLGIEHIWTGYDHLLFVLGLLLLVKKRSILIWTITAFTVAHSISLALATFGIVKVNSSFTEAAIALSIVFLAVEIIKANKGKKGFAYNYPWIVSFLFGLLHGLGFASVLQDVGLPENNIPSSLFLFNIGIEAGQLVFVAIIILIAALVRKSGYNFPKWSYKIPSYLIGTLAMFWLIERVVAVF